MKITDFDYSNMSYLLNGFYEENDKLMCLYCNEKIEKKMMVKHQAKHKNIEKFEHLIYGDTIFGFSALEKAYLLLIFEGRSDGEIAKILDKPASTIRWMKGEFRKRFRQARAMLLLSELLGDQLKSKRINNKNAHGSDNPLQDDGISFNNDTLPVINEKRKVTAFCNTKHQLHLSGKLHPTCIIIVAKIFPDTGEPAILVVDKADKKMTTDKSVLITKALDVLGGHCRRRDANMELEKPFPLEEAMWNCVRREMAAELKIHKIPIDNSRISFLCEDRYKGKIADGINNELSWMFLYRYNGTLDVLNIPGEVRIKDDWIDSLGERVERIYVGKFWRLSEIIREVNKSPENVNDGLLRFIEKYKNDKILANKIIELLNMK